VSLLTRAPVQLALVVLLLAVPIAASCGDDDGEPAEPGGPGMPNPASVYCEEQGGRVEMEQDPAGGERGICVFDDGSRVDEWDYYREHHGS
jgi:putative hemolysin